MRPKAPVEHLTGRWFVGILKINRDLKGGEMMEIGSRMLKGMSGHDAGRQLLADMYRQLTGNPMPEITVTDRGKPCFVTGDLHFSISHTKTAAFCVLSDRPVGIDAENIDRNIDLALAERISSPPERQRYEDAPDKRKALLRLWVLKEAYAKATGRGWGSYLYKTDFDPNDPRIKKIDGCFVAVIEL